MSTLNELHTAIGAEAFTKTITDSIPYFGTIDPLVTEVRNGFAVVFLKNQKKVHNHLGTVHAIAMCNAAEIVAGVVAENSTPDGARWIPKEMTVKYLAKAKTDLRVTAEAESVDFSQTGDIVIPIVAYDADCKPVFTADITMDVKHAVK